GHEPWFVVDGGAGDLDGVANGSFRTNWYVNPDDSAGSSFLLTAAGDQGSFASHTFTDAVSLQYSSLADPLTVTASTVSFTQFVTAPARPTPQTQTFTATVKPSGLPAGVTVTTSPSSLSFGPVYPSTPSWVVTFNVDPSVPNGTYTNIKIKAEPSDSSVSQG